eukprot:7472536-Alexandrium_andersonii.AAC.1
MGCLGAIAIAYRCVARHTLLATSPKCTPIAGEAGASTAGVASEPAAAPVVQGFGHASAVGCRAAVAEIIRAGLIGLSLQFALLLRLLWGRR